MVFRVGLTAFEECISFLPKELKAFFVVVLWVLIKNQHLHRSPNPVNLVNLGNPAPICRIRGSCRSSFSIQDREVSYWCIETGRSLLPGNAEGKGKDYSVSSSSSSCMISCRPVAMRNAIRQRPMEMANSHRYPMCGARIPPINGAKLAGNSTVFINPM